MKFIFNFGCGPAAAALLGLSACRAASATTPAAAPRDGGDAYRLVALLDYVAGDYPRAVQNGAVVSATEYDEQVHFAEEARSMATALAPTAPAPADGLLALVADVGARVRARADAPVVAGACRAARDEAVTLFRLRTMPTRRSRSIHPCLQIWPRPNIRYKLAGVLEGSSSPRTPDDRR